MSTLRVLGPVVLASLFAAAVVGCGPSISKGQQGSGNGTTPGSTQNGVTGNAVCASAEHTVTTTSRSGASIALDGNYVYVREYGSDGAGLTRTPIMGGAEESIDAAEVDVFAIGGSGTVVWSRYSNMAPTVNRVDAKHGMTSLTLPDAATNVTALAVDGNDNVFVLANDKTGGNTVWRYSASHDQFDLIHHNLGGLQGFIRDVDSIAWIGPSSSGSPAIYREDVLGGAPTVLMPLDPQNGGGQQVVGIDAQNVYVATNGYVITAIDRSSMVQRTALDLTPSPNNNENQTYAEINTVTVDDTYFYWIETTSGGGQSMLMRSAKTSDQPEVVTTVTDLQSIAVAGCNVAYTGNVDPTNADQLGVVIRPR